MWEPVEGTFVKEPACSEDQTVNYGREGNGRKWGGKAHSASCCGWGVAEGMKTRSTKDRSTLAREIRATTPREPGRTDAPGLLITHGTTTMKHTHMTKRCRISKAILTPGSSWWQGKWWGRNQAQTDLIVHPALGQSGDELGCIVDVGDQAPDQRQEASVPAHFQGWIEDQPIVLQLHADLEQRRDALLKQGVMGSRPCPWLTVLNA